MSGNVLTSRCKVPTCTRNHWADGFCEPHFEWRRTLPQHLQRIRAAKRLPASWRRTTG